MQALFATGRIVDVILVLLVVEGIGLAGAWQWRGRCPAPRRFVPTLVAGAGLLLALRAALVDAPWHWIAMGLSLALVGHVVDLASRWRA